MVQILLVLRILGKRNATELDPIHCNTMPFLISGPTLAISNTLNFVWSNPTLQRTYQESRLLRATILSCVDFYVECLLWIGYKCFCRKNWGIHVCGKFFTTFRLPMNIGYLLLFSSSTSLYYKAARSGLQGLDDEEWTYLCMIYL